MSTSTSAGSKGRTKQRTLLVAHGAHGHEKLLVGIDEAGRGPLLGRVYVAAAVLPPPDVGGAPGAGEAEGAEGAEGEREPAEFEYSRMKDSKRFSSRKALDKTAAYIKQRALGWSVRWMDEAGIDRHNILEATVLTMQDAALDVVRQLEHEDNGKSADDVLLLVDGDHFRPVAAHSPAAGRKEVVKHELVRKGDDTYACIAAASILAKSARDAYVDELCDAHPELDERYGLRRNKGYGTAAHMEGLRAHGVSPWHRRSFRPCA